MGGETTSGAKVEEEHSEDCRCWVGRRDWAEDRKYQEMTLEAFDEVVEVCKVYRVVWILRWLSITPLDELVHQ